MKSALIFSIASIGLASGSEVVRPFQAGGEFFAYEVKEDAKIFSEPKWGKMVESAKREFSRVYASEYTQCVSIRKIQELEGWWDVVVRDDPRFLNPEQSPKMLMIIVSGDGEVANVRSIDITEGNRKNIESKFVEFLGK